MLDLKTQELVSYLDGTLRNCENVLFSNFNEPNVANKDIELRSNLSSRQVAKIYGFTQKLLTKHIDQLGVGVNTEDTGYQEEVSAIVVSFCFNCMELNSSF
jgi:hypothetical protein